MGWVFESRFLGSFLMKSCPVYYHIIEFKKYFRLLFKYAKFYPVFYSFRDRTGNGCTILKITFFFFNPLVFRGEGLPLKANLSHRELLFYISRQPLSQHKKVIISDSLGLLPCSMASLWSCPRFYFLPFLFLAPLIIQRSSRG